VFPFSEYNTTKGSSISLTFERLDYFWGERLPGWPLLILTAMKTGFCHIQR